ncbi:hypothetical protein Tco_0843609 [Tanacetum coccineum]|uniref:Uncharacterized protein n=1 Tax=Tanacetum coccineum TaxID=301880 RepID=A0ABQ5B643_9ASTR
MSTRSSARRLLSPIEDPERLLIRRNRSNRHSFFNLEEDDMAGQAPPQGPIPDLRSMEELLQAPTDGVRDAIVPGTDDRGCGYFMWMDDLTLHISSSSGSSTPPSYSPGTSTRPSYSPGTSTRPSYSPGSSRSAQNLGKAECSNCKFLAEKIKTLEAKIIKNVNRLGMGCCGKLMMRVGPLVLSLDGKLLVHPEWKILQTLTNNHRLKLICALLMLLDHLLIFQTLTNGAKRKLDHLLLHLVNGLLWKTNDESGTPRSQSGWKTSWAKKDDKEDQCASRVEDSSNTNQWGKKEAGSSPSSSGKWAAVEN